MEHGLGEFQGIQCRLWIAPGSKTTPWIHNAAVTNLNLPAASDGHHPALHLHSSQQYLQTVQAGMVLAVIFACCGLLIFICQLFTLKKGNRFIFTGLFQLLSCLCLMTAASVYTVHFHSNDENGSYGSSYILAWICFPLTLISSIMYVILRKRE
ncbi:hypothetical protein scyTo_0017636 [Scyliorhinus torazame]|uniref:Peripheral myelin protein 22 n=1 Tax=Scyliorhinus torazame TaxID=75743 RepID=A0A401PX00_SCYTO|nr:hypothetical protein [Scyliorhinus torazame]